MTDTILMVADGRPDLAGLPHELCRFEDATPERLAQHGRVLLMPMGGRSPEISETILDWKRDGLLPETRLFFGTYGGRHLWSPSLDALVEGWLVHTRSERLVLDSDRLMFIPLCRNAPPDPVLAGDDGYVFMGGRKWREIDIGLAAMVRSGLPAASSPTSRPRPPTRTSRSSASACHGKPTWPPSRGRVSSSSRCCRSRSPTGTRMW